LSIYEGEEGRAGNGALEGACWKRRARRSVLETAREKERARKGA
jgi:hypothetical protein